MKSFKERRFLLPGKPFHLIKKKAKHSCIFTLSYEIAGINTASLKKKCFKYGLPLHIKYNSLPKHILKKLMKIIIKTEPNNRQNFKNTKLIFIQRINIYKGNRHKNGYPSNGQRTYSNARTARKMKIIIQNLKKILKE